MEHPKDHFSQDTYDLLALAVASLGLLGLCSNLLMLILYYKYQGLRTPSNLLLVNISISNFLSSIFGASFTFMSCMRLWWTWDSVACVCEGFFRSLFDKSNFYHFRAVSIVIICVSAIHATSIGLISSFTLTVLAYERYSRVIHDKIIDFSWTWRAVLCIWLYSGLWAVAPLIGWNRYTFENHGLDCALNWMPSGPNELSFILTFVLACIAIPIVVILYCYSQMVNAIQKLVIASDPQAVQVIKIINYEKYMIKISVVMVLELLCYWVPYAVISLLTISGFDRLTTPTNTLVPLFISKSVAASNPVTYIFVNRKFRQGLRALCFHYLGFYKILSGKHLYRHGKRIQPFGKSHRAGNKAKRRLLISSSSILCNISTVQTETHHTDKNSIVIATNVQVIHVQPL